MRDKIITRVSLFFVKRSRFTILIILGLLTIGAYSYTNILKKEGFPTINIPYVIVTTPYLSGDPSKTEAEITKPIYDSILELDEIKEISSNSSDSFASVVVTLEEDGVDTEEIRELIEERIKLLELPSPSQVSVPDVGRVDGESDVLLAIYSDDLTVSELQAKGELLATEIEKSDFVLEADVKEQFVERFDFAQNQETIVQESFSRLILVEDGEEVSYDTINIGVVKEDREMGTLDFSEALHLAIDEALETEELKDLQVSYTGDPAESLKIQISSLENNAVAAIITIFIILLLFIDLRSALILALFIPMTLGAVFITFALFGLSLNTISLFALVLVLGLFVDDGIVVVEAIDFYKRQGIKGVDAVRKAINDIGVADISGTLTTVLVFFPLVFIEGILGEFIRILPITVIISLFVSLVIALTILPFISRHFLKDAKMKDGKVVTERSIFERIFEFVPTRILKLGGLLSRYVKFALSSIYYKIAVVIISIALVGVGLYFSGQIGFSYFAPPKDSEELSVAISFTQPTDIKSARDLSIQVEQLILGNSAENIKEITYYAGNSRTAQLKVTLTPITEREETSADIAKTINDDTKGLNGAVVNASIVSAGPPESQYPFAMQVYAEDQELLDLVTKDISKFIPTVRLSNKVEVEDVKVESVSEISRRDGNRYATIRVKFSEGSDSATIVELKEEIENEYSESVLDAEYGDVSLAFDFGQESDNAESFESVVLAGMLALVVMYGLLVLQFNSFTQPLLILLAIPFSFPGLFLGLYLTGNPMSFFVVIGLTGLIGIVVNNTIMLIEYANAKRAEGYSSLEAISEATKLRTRPILTTTLTTVCGLVPLALAEPFWEPLAFTIIFGLISSMMMLFFAFPIFYHLVQSGRDLAMRVLRRG